MEPSQRQPDQTAPWANPTHPSGRQFFRKLIPWMFVTVIAALITAGLWPKPIAVEAGTVCRSALTVSILEEGKTRVRNRYVISVPVSGKMQRVTLKAGDAVKANETVITLIQPIDAPLLDPRARMQAEAAVSLQEAAKQRAEQSLQVARISYDRAASEQRRIHEAENQKFLSQSDRETIDTNAAMKAAEVRALEFALKISDYELAQARAVLMRPSNQTQDNLIAVTAPVSGVVLQVMQESETIANAGMQILEIGDLADLEIEAEILSRDAVAIQPGAMAIIEQSGTATPLQGRVRRIEPAAFTKVSSLGVEEQRVIVLIELIQPENAPLPLGDRYRVEARITTWHSDDTLTIPSSALFRENNSWKTYLMQDGKAHKTDVEIGQSDGKLSQLLSGLNEGDRVLLHPPDAVKDQSRVVEK